MGKDELFEAAATHCLWHLESLDLKHTARLLFAWGLSGPRDPWILEAFDGRLRKLLRSRGLESLSAGDAANLALALKGRSVRVRRVSRCMSGCLGAVEFDRGSCIVASGRMWWDMMGIQRMTSARCHIQNVACP